MSGNSHWLSRISPGPDLGFRDLAALGGLDPYGQHRLLWKFFDLPRDRKRAQTEFLFRAEVREGLPLFYVVSRIAPKDATGKWRIEPREYRPNLRVDDRLAFKLRANPVNLAKRDRDSAEVASWARNREKRGLEAKDVTRKRVRYDVVMDAKQRMNWNDLAPADRPPLNQIAYDAGSCWLRQREERTGCDFGANRLRVDGHRVHRMNRRRGIVISTLDFEGELQVTHPEAFVSALLTGIGPAKAFGCGLLLVRRIANL
ncbi:MAG: type I-E CRISPR-associated protein Cas6/Cse3/CasE [Pseudomonadota bacterium]|nr:type I-E CRISPR-associated protein Cas6/Cse3/CasE [Pseudomonadota bacterium]